MARGAGVTLCVLLCVATYADYAAAARMGGAADAFSDKDAPLRPAPAAPEDGVLHEKPEFFWYNPVSGESTWDNPFPTQHTDDDGNTFLVDPANHDSTWWEQDPPEEWAWEQAEATEGDNAGSTYYHNKKTNEVTWDVPKMLAWKKMSSERIFYYNRVTGESVAERPKEMGFWSEEHGRFYWVDDAGEATWESEHWWTEVPWEDDPTKIYYVNEKTGETSWEMPKSMGWIQWHEEL